MEYALIGDAPELRNRRTSSDYIADALRNAINGGQLEDGAILNQVELAEHFGVSRVPVREAIRRLEAEGLVEAAAHRRAVVRGLSLARIAEVYELRALLEGHLVAQAAPHVDSATIGRLIAINDEMSGASDRARWLELNTAFHATLYAPADRETALELVDTLRNRGERYVQMWSRGRGLERTSRVTNEHAAIVRLVEQGDADGARRAMVEHIEHTRDAVLTLYREPPAG
ncbi:GntR family transcriptional regulator [Conexibacter woesei]|uniref:GntR family transcriptional regulator n=1 Tax=Conexibacter woesei TaxID=191495 RepID=UPI0002E0336B|nr:GntR family transcriptional regulator [Conexibacter woesei]